MKCWYSTELKKFSIKPDGLYSKNRGNPPITHPDYLDCYPIHIKKDTDTDVYYFGSCYDSDDDIFQDDEDRLEKKFKQWPFEISDGEKYICNSEKDYVFNGINVNEKKYNKWCKKKKKKNDDEYVGEEFYESSIFYIHSKFKKKERKIFSLNDEPNKDEKKRTRTGRRRKIKL